MKRFFSIFLISVLLAATNCRPVDEGYEPAPILSVSFSYVDEEEKDLLDPETFGFFNIYYLQKNEESGEFELNEARSPQHSFYRHKITGLIVLQVYPNPEYTDGHSTTYIESPRDNIDTLEVEAQIQGRGVIPETIWYNGEKLWDDSKNPQDFYFTIPKSGSF